MLLILHPPAQVQPAPGPGAKPLPLAEAVEAVLAAYEDGLELPAPKVAPRDRAALAWLRATAQEGPPANPFPPGSSAHAEAAALRKLLADAVPPGDFQRVALRQVGSQLAFWRWGQAQVRRGAFPEATRLAWEDRLLKAGSDSVIRGFALRHALCHALARQDEARFAQLKGRHGAESLDLFSGFQRLFSMLGGPTPTFRLWRLPGLQASEVRLDQLGARRVWIHPAPADLPAWGPDLAWVIPAARGETGAEETHPHGADREEAEELSRRLQAQGRQAWFVPTRGEWAQAGLDFFPILLEFDGQGQVTAIRMGDAAPKMP